MSFLKICTNKFGEILKDEMCEFLSHENDNAIDINTHIIVFHETCQLERLMLDNYLLMKPISTICKRGTF